MRSATMRRKASEPYKGTERCLPVVLCLVLGLLIVRTQLQPLEGVQRRVVVVLRTYVNTKADIVLWRPVWPASQNALANGPRLAEAGGCPELDLAMEGVLEANWPKPLGGCCFPHSSAPVYASASIHSRGMYLGLTSRIRRAASAPPPPSPSCARSHRRSHCTQAAALSPTRGRYMAGSSTLSSSSSLAPAAPRSAA